MIKRNATALTVSFALLLFVVFVWAAGAASENEIKIICNTDVSNDSLKKNDVKNIFLGRKTRWDDKTRIIFSLSDQKGIQRVFLKKFVSKSPAQYSAYWKKMVFSGKGVYPKVFKTEEELLNFIATTRGAIGFSSSGINRKDIKAITITD